MNVSCDSPYDDLASTLTYLPPFLKYLLKDRHPRLHSIRRPNQLRQEAFTPPKRVANLSDGNR